jgi:NTP pyrophosphatase (non-canonical NTP hydrolase)
MKLEDYIKESARTESPLYQTDKVKPETVHAAMGLVTESGELLQIIKRTLFYDIPLNRTHIKEEIGDILWYVSQLLRSEGWAWEEVMEENIEKLRKRYPEQFTSDLAQERKDKGDFKQGDEVIAICNCSHDKHPSRGIVRHMPGDQTYDEMNFEFADQGFLIESHDGLLYWARQNHFEKTG